MKTLSIFLIFLFSATFITPAYGAHFYDFPTWVKKGAFVNYTVQGDFSMKYNEEYYFIWSFSEGYLHWEIEDISGNIATLHIKLLCAYLNVGNDPSLYLPEGIIKLLKPTNREGYVNYSVEKTIKVNYIKREIVSNNGFVNLWINPAADVYYGSIPPDIQRNPNAKPFLKYSPARYIPKYMIFPSNRSMTINTHTFHDVLSLRVTGNSQEARENWTYLSNSGAYGVECVNMPNLTESPFLGGTFDRDTGILITGDWYDDILVSNFGLYGTFILKYNKTNIYTNSENSFGISMEGIITLSVLIICGVAVWVLWKRKR